MVEAYRLPRRNPSPFAILLIGAISLTMSIIGTAGSTLFWLGGLILGIVSVVLFIRWRLERPTAAWIGLAFGILSIGVPVFLWLLWASATGD
jgi:hypothetical protein